VRVKTVRASSVKEAMEQIKDELGSDALPEGGLAARVGLLAFGALLLSSARGEWRGIVSSLVACLQWSA